MPDPEKKAAVPDKKAAAPAAAALTPETGGCCAKVLVLVFKPIIGVLCIIKLIFIVLDLMHLIAEKDAFIEKHSTVYYYISIVFLAYAIFNLLGLVVQILLEKTCALIWNLVFMLADLGWEIYTFKYVHTVGFVFHCVLTILLACYILFIYCK